jgi:hypothetical protein
MSSKDFLKTVKMLERVRVSELDHRGSGANFTSILSSAFLHKVIPTDFLYLKFGFILFRHKKIGGKAVHQMLVKLTTGVDQISIFFFISNFGCQARIYTWTKLFSFIIPNF